MNLIVPPDDPPLVQPPPTSNLKRSTKIRINGTTIEIDPENTKPVKQLGHGAYGFVELIEHEPSGIQLAVKVRIFMNFFVYGLSLCLMTSIFFILHKLAYMCIKSIRSGSFIS